MPVDDIRASPKIKVDRIVEPIAGDKCGVFAVRKTQFTSTRRRPDLVAG
jgi:hypothetical protein